MNLEKWLLDKLAKQPKPKPKSRYAVRDIDQFDQEDLAAMRRDIRRYALARSKLIDVAENTGGSLTDDTSMLLYKVAPEMEERGRMDPRFLLNWLVEQELVETPEMERVRTWTEGDIVNTAASFVDIEPILEQLLDKKSKEMEEQAERIEELQEQLDALTDQSENLDELVERWQQGGIFDPDGDECGGGQDAQDALAAAIADLEAQIGQAASPWMRLPTRPSG
jgi:polyhydroxyalkanoate synthesis regulator phasin